METMIPNAASSAVFTPASPADTSAALKLEQGHIIFLPNEPFLFTPDERIFLDPATVAEGSKTVKYDPQQNRIWGAADQYKDSPALTALMARWSAFARDLVLRHIPQYAPSLITGNASFRPVEAAGRVQSKRHDDQLLHVDAFPSRPSQGKRILRIFANVDPGGHERRWDAGEPFATVAKRFMPRITAPLPGSAAFLRLFKITKSRRTPYDHYMMHIHDAMKLDDQYQAVASRTPVNFPAGSTWIVFTDQVSHAALSGRHAMEQTFLLPADAMQDPTLSPLATLEKIQNRRLV